MRERVCTEAIRRLRQVLAHPRLIRSYSFTGSPRRTWRGELQPPAITRTASTHALAKFSGCENYARMREKTDPVLAFRFCEALFEALREALSDPAVVRARMIAARTKVKGRGKSDSLREEHFCKGCILPVVDTVATKFLAAELSLTRAEVHAALRCEGITNLLQIYQPNANQAGFSRATWGKNYQLVNKQGRTAPTEHRGYQPCPDFGVVQRFQRSMDTKGDLALGETVVGRKAQTSCRNCRLRSATAKQNP